MSNHTTFEILVYMLLKNSKGELLLLQNDVPGSTIEGYLNPPAGHLEPSESITTAALRETAEETGITKLTNIRIKGVINVFGFKPLPVVMFIISGKVPLSQKTYKMDEGTPVWVKITDLPKYKVLEDVEKIIKLADQTPQGNIFQVVSTFAHRKLKSFKIL